MYILPFGIHNVGKMILAGVAILFAALFFFTVQIMPTWQAASAILVLLVALGYLLSKKQMLFELNEAHDAIDTNNEEVLTPVEKQVIQVNDTQNELEPIEAEVQEVMDTNESEIDVLPNKEEVDYFEEFYSQLDSSSSKDDEMEEHKVVLNSFSEVATTGEEEKYSQQLKETLSDDYLLELFEGREIEGITETGTVPAELQQINEERRDLVLEEESSDLNDLFESLMNNDQVEGQLDEDVTEKDNLRSIYNEEDDTEIKEEVLSEENVESLVKEEDDTEIPEEVLSEENVESLVKEEDDTEIPEEVLSEEDVESLVKEEVDTEIPEEVLSEENVESLVKEEDDTEIPEEVLLEEDVESLVKVEDDTEIPEEVLSEENVESPAKEEDATEIPEEVLSKEMVESLIDDSESQNEGNRRELSNDLLDMLLEQFIEYKKVLPAKQFEQILQQAINKATSEKDYFLFAKELLFYYLQTENVKKFEELSEMMNEKLKHYPILIEQLSWVNLSTKKYRE